MDLGTSIEYLGRPAVRFERVYPHSIDRVWSAVTEPDELAHWFPASVAIEGRPGGSITFSGDPHAPDRTGRVLVFEPRRRLAYTWGDDELRFDLEELSGGHCRLTLVNVLSDRSQAARNGAGWVVCLAELDKHVGGQETRGPHSDSALEWQPVYDAHVAAGLPAGADVPSS